MFKENWRIIWKLADEKNMPVDDAYDMFRQAVKYGLTIEGVDFDFKAAHEAWVAMTEKEQRKALEEYNQHCRAGYWQRVKEYNNN